MFLDLCKIDYVKLHSCQHFPEYAQRELRRDDYILIPRVEGVECERLLAYGKLLEICAAVIEENTDLTGHEAALLAHPYDLPVVIARLHAVSGDAHTEVRALRDLRACLYHFVILTVEELAGAGGYRQ